MQIGLIGGIGPAATDFYYRSLIEKFASEDADLDMTIVHADASTLVKNLMDDNKDAQVSIYNGLTKRLKNHTLMETLFVHNVSILYYDGPLSLIKQLALEY